MLVRKLVLCAALAAPVSACYAQSSSYTITQAVMSGGTQTVYRSGSKALVETMLPGNHAKTLYDLAAMTSLTWNPDASPISCAAASFKGDWGDPFAMTAEVNDGVAKGELKPAGTATIAGTQAAIYTGDAQGSTTKVWFDKSHNLVLRVEASMPGNSAAPMIMVDIRKVSLAAPPSSMFVAPAACAGAKPPPSAADLIADETGDDAANYANGIYGPGSQNSCSVVLKVVQAKTMTPVTKIQVAIDTTAYGQNTPPPYTFGVAPDGTTTYSGGHVREITSMVHNGVVKIGLPPANFQIGVNHIRPNRGGSLGMIYRQCFAPTQVLLYVIKDIDTPNESADFLWVKSGKYATP